MHQNNQTGKSRKTLVRGVYKFKNKSVNTYRLRTVNLNYTRAQKEFIPSLNTTKTQ